jgi:hypothetical protein
MTREELDKHAPMGSGARDAFVPGGPSDSHDAVETPRPLDVVPPSPTRSFRTGPSEASKDLRALHAIVRTLLRAEEKHRLYPEGHQQTRRAIKDVLQSVQAYAEETGKSFSFVTEYALGLRETDHSAIAKDFGALAYNCRVRLLRRFTIRPEADCDALEGLVRLLHLPTPGEATLSDEQKSAPIGVGVDVEWSEDSIVEDGYLFTDDGQQLFSATPGSFDASTPLPEHLPPSLRRTLARVFARSDVRERLEGLRSRVASAPSADRSTSVDFVGQIVRHVFDDPATLVDTPEEDVERKIADFLAVLEGVAGAMPSSQSEIEHHRAISEREIFRRAAGVGTRDGRGFAETVLRGEPVEKLLARDAEKPVVSREPSEPRPLRHAVDAKEPSLADVAQLFPSSSNLVPPPLSDSSTARETVPASSPIRGPNSRSFRTTESQAREPQAREPQAREPQAREPHARETLAREPLAREPHAREPQRREVPANDSRASDATAPKHTTTREIESSTPTELSGIEPPREPDDEFAWLRAAPFDPDRLARHMQDFDYGLEALRVRGEVLAAMPKGGRSEQVIASLSNAYNTHPWSDGSSWATELAALEDVLPEDLREQVLSRTITEQTDQALIDGWFLRKLKSGTSISSLSPLLERVRDSAPERSLNALIRLWREGGRQDRPLVIETFYRIHRDAEDIAAFGERCPQAFGSQRSVEILESLPTSVTGKVCLTLLGSRSRNAPGMPQALMSCLRAVAPSAEGESCLYEGLRETRGAARRELLSMIDHCTKRDLFDLLEKMLEEENLSPDPDLEQVRLIVSILVKSDLPHVKNLLRRVRTERKALFHVFRREIRDILDILIQLEGGGR